MDRNQPGPWLRPRWVSHGVRAPADRVWFQVVFAKSKHKIRVSSFAPSPHRAVAFSGVPLTKVSCMVECLGSESGVPPNRLPGLRGEFPGGAGALLHISGADSAYQRLTEARRQWAHSPREQTNSKLCLR